VINGAGHTIMLRGPDGEQYTEIGEDELYQFDRLGPGKYYVRVKNTLLRRSGLKMTGRNHRRVNFAMPMLTPAESVIYGRVPGGAGWQLYVRGPNGLEIVQPLDEHGGFEIGGLKAGDYKLVLQAPEAEYTESVTLDGLERARVVFETVATTSATGWTWRAERVGSGPGFALIRVRVTGQAGVPVRLWTDGWMGILRRTGEKPEFGPDVCEFAPLGEGYYYVQPAGLSDPVRVEVPGSDEIWVTFATDGEGEPVPPPKPSQPEKKPSIFVLIKNMPTDLAAFVQTMRFAARSHATFGDDIEEAMKADKVIVMASSQQVTDADIARLEEAGCEVIRVAPPYYATRLRELLEDGTIP
jgi:hypothetical protein